MPARAAELLAQTATPNACIPQPERDRPFVRVQDATQSPLDKGAQRRFLFGRVGPRLVDEIVGKFDSRLHSQAPVYC